MDNRPRNMGSLANNAVKQQIKNENNGLQINLENELASFEHELQPAATGRFASGTHDLGMIQNDSQIDDPSFMVTR